MCIDNKSVGKQIALLRSSKKLTQSDLGERLNLSYQAISKWERGETLPDVAILPQLASILETTIDNILCGNTLHAAYKGTIKVNDMIDGIKCLKEWENYLEKKTRYTFLRLMESMTA